MSEPSNEASEIGKQDKPDSEPQTYKDDGKPKGTCSACMYTVMMEAVLVIDKQARCPHCGAVFINFRF